MSILDEGYFRKINSPSVAVGYDISPLKRVKLRIFTTSRHLLDITDILLKVA
jgi:hypothetical protein